MNEDELLNQAREAAAALAARAGFAQPHSLDLIKFRENAVFKLTTPEGCYALRAHRPGYRTREDIESEAAWTAALREAGVATPRFAALSGGAPVEAVRTASGSEFLCDALEWIDGEPMKRDNIVERFRQVGRIAATVHAHARGWTPPAGFCRPVFDQTTLFGKGGLWGDYARLDALSANQLDLLDRAAARVASILAAEPRTEDRWGLLHGDLMLENLLVDGEEVCVIDFDDCGFGFYAYDLATAVTLHVDAPCAAAMIEQWVQGYAEVMDPDAIGLHLLEPLVMARFLLGVGWLHGRAGSATAEEIGADLIAGACGYADYFLSSG